MATIAVAASAALMKPVIEKLSSNLWKDMSMFCTLDKECNKTKNMLTIISMVLADAEKKSITDDLIRHWLLKLQDIAYDVDDLLDDLQIEEQRRSKVLKELHLESARPDIVVHEEAIVETEGMRMMFPCLEKLTLIDCAFLAVFPFLPRNIQDLDIAVLPDWLGSLSFLKSLRVVDCEMIKEFPESMSHLTALQFLELSNLPNAERLPKGTEEIASLQRLIIRSCFHLSMEWRVEVQQLKKIYFKRGEDEEWYKISHIRDIDIRPVTEDYGPGYEKSDDSDFENR
ncbi:Disease resistance protein (CC-NBS-LRR class) family [Rhynchospora pubera]|uniref:Disease resistance protein (CC-NBS-LRR class) family n=1 Tax=Rhynchospora pubera TaxID=906938 RepID=A0AAV8E4H4_9POAL|nr:Disease resistance protein (CC-NBS-LRR class) family [Rhynchospora pubera]